MLDRCIAVCKDLFVTFGWYVVAAVAVIALVGLYAAATRNTALLVVVGLALVGLILLIERGDGEYERHEREARALEDARRAADRIKLERARSLLAEPSIHQVMPNHGAEQEL